MKIQRLVAKTLIGLLPLLLAIRPPRASGDDSNPVVAMPPEQVLRNHNVGITKKALVVALRNDDAKVRRAASAVLASRWPKQAIPLIKEAMRSEPDPRGRIGMALELVKLGDNTGREMLRSECHDKNEWGSVRILAARSLIELHDDSCVDSVLEILQRNSDPQDTVSKTDALDLVPAFIGRIREQDSKRAAELVVLALDDPDIGVRAAASDVLSRLGQVSAIPRLQDAVAREHDSTVRGEMARNLNRLQELQAAK